MSERGTLEALIGELTIMLSPLADLTPERSHRVMLELGIAVSPEQAATLGAAASATTSSLGALIELGEAIAADVESEDWTKVIADGIKATAQIAKLIEGATTLANTISSLGLAGVTPAMISKLPEQLINWLLATYFRRSAGVSELLQLTGILARTDHNIGSVDPAQPFYTTNAFDFGRVGGWMSDPTGQLVELYDWGTPAFGPKLLGLVDQLVGQAGLPSLYDPAAPDPVVDLSFVQLGVHPGPGNQRGLEVRLRDGVGVGSFAVGASNYTITVTNGFELPHGIALVLAPAGLSLLLPDAVSPSGSLSVELSYKQPGRPLTLLSIGGGSSVTVEEVGGAAGVEVKPSGDVGFDLGVELKGGKARISAEGADGFLATLLSGIHIENTFDLGIGFSTEHGVYFHGSSTLAIQLASHINLGPIEIQALTLTIGIQDGKFPVGLTTDLKADMGPLQAVVQGIGFSLDFALASGNSGNLGPLDLSASFVPPTGVGLSLDAGVVKGGGYLLFDTERGEYGGALELDIAEIVNAKAIGVITTKMPDGSSGFALIIIITAEFNPAFQLGYGFTLNGVGGMLGLNRGMDLAALRAGVKSNSIESVMFPADVVANAPQIISDLRTLFPVEPGTFLIGPMAKLGWGTPTLISLSFGLILAIPTEGGSPEIALIGILKIALPTDELDLIKVQINIVGTIDFDEGLLAIDAELFDSHLLFLTLEGSLAIRLKWKEPAGFLVSIGGFHPSYTPPPELQCQAMKRLAVNILDTDFARIRVEVYFAVTSNSVQTGAKAELYFGFDGFYVDGYLGFDALFQFSPFHFEIGISAGLTLHVIGIDLLSIRLAFNLSGPSPWHAWGTGSVTILFWDITADFDITWGDHTDTTLPDVDVLPLLLADLADPAHWKALPAASTKPWVSVRAAAPGGDHLVLHPSGRLTVQQKTAPLDLTWEKFGNQHPADIHRASIAGATSGGRPLKVTPIEDSFARSQFENLSDAEKLSVPQFEAMHAGARLALGKDAEGGTAVERTIEFETIVIDQEPAPRFRIVPIIALHRMQLQGTAKRRAETSRLSKRLLDPFEPNEKVAVGADSYTVASTIDNRAHAANATFSSHAMAAAYLARKIADEPALAETLHVIPVAEVNAA